MRPRSQFQFPFGQLALLSASFHSHRLLPHHHIQAVSHGMGGRGERQIIRAGPQPHIKFTVSQRFSEMLAMVTHQVILLCLYFSLDWVHAGIYFQGLFLLSRRLDDFSIQPLYCQSRLLGPN